MSINEQVAICHQASLDAGWWTDINTGEPIDTSSKDVVAARLMLIVSELSEAMEGHRKNKMDDHLPLRRSFEVELADTAIRIFDLAGAMRLDLGGAISEKVAYNRTRKDHKILNRRKEGGKRY